MARYEFIGRPPKSFTIVFVFAFVNGFVSWIAVAFHQFWARESSGGEFTYSILFKGGQTLYFTLTVGRYIDWSFVGHFVAFALLAFICYRHRDAMVRLVSQNAADASSQPSPGVQPNMPLQPTSGSDDRRESH